MTQTQQKKWQAREKDRRLIRFLTDLTEKNDRAALTHLRYGLRGMPGDLYLMGKYIVPFLSSEPKPSDTWYYLVAALYADVYREIPYNEGVSLGEAFRNVPMEFQNDSLETLFLTMLNSSVGMLPDRIKQAIGLLKSRDTSLDWALLLSDLCSWERPDRMIQRRWAHNFYYRPVQEDSQNPESEIEEPAEEYDDED